MQEKTTQQKQTSFKNDRFIEAFRLMALLCLYPFCLKLSFTSFGVSSQLYLLIWHALCVAPPDGRAPACLTCDTVTEADCQATGTVVECPASSDEVRQPNILHILPN